jgi:hypothetical protein
VLTAAVINTMKTFQKELAKPAKTLTVLTAPQLLINVLNVLKDGSYTKKIAYLYAQTETTLQMV